VSTPILDIFQLYWAFLCIRILQKRAEDFADSQDSPPGVPPMYTKYYLIGPTKKFFKIIKKFRRLINHSSLNNID
jgi:hypothetical protein